MGSINFKNQLIISSSIIVGSMIAVAAVIYIFVGKIDTTVTKITADKALINQQTGALAVVAALKEQVPQAAAYQAQMEQLMPTQDGLIGFGEWLNNAATANNVMVNMSFESNISPASAGAAGTAPFSFTANGDQDDLSAFLSDVETQASGFLVQITSFDLTNTNGSYQLTGQGNVFFQL